MRTAYMAAEIRQMESNDDKAAKWVAVWCFRSIEESFAAGWKLREAELSMKYKPVMKSWGDEKSR